MNRRTRKKNQFDYSLEWANVFRHINESFMVNNCIYNDDCLIYYFVLDVKCLF